MASKNINISLFFVALALSVQLHAQNEHMQRLEYAIEHLDDAQVTACLKEMDSQGSVLTVVEKTKLVALAKKWLSYRKLEWGPADKAVMKLGGIVTLMGLTPGILMMINFLGMRTAMKRDKLLMVNGIFLIAMSQVFTASGLFLLYWGWNHLGVVGLEKKAKAILKHIQAAPVKELGTENEVPHLPLGVANDA